MRHYRVKMRDSVGEYFLFLSADSVEDVEELVNVDGYGAVFVSAELLCEA